MCCLNGLWGSLPPFSSEETTDTSFHINHMMCCEQSFGGGGGGLGSVPKGPKFFTPEFHSPTSTSSTRVVVTQTTILLRAMPGVNPRGGRKMEASARAKT